MVLLFYGTALAAAPAVPAAVPAAKLSSDATDPVRLKQIDDAAAVLVERCDKLIAENKPRTAYGLLMQARQQLGEVRNIRIETTLGRLAVIEKAPEKAFEFLDPYTSNLKTYSLEIGLACLAAGDANLALNRNQQALVLFDWVAAKAEAKGDAKTLILTAEGCGKALMAMKEYAKAVEALDFAVRYGRRPQMGEYDFGDLLNRVQGLLDKARRLADIDMFGEDFVLYRDAERMRRQEKRFKEARDVYQDILKRFGEGPYADASQLYGAMCLIEMGKVKEAEKELAALRAANPYGPYSGEALLELGKLALEYHMEAKVAQGTFALLDTWIDEVKNKPVLNITKLAVPPVATKITLPPPQEKYVDFWGNVKKSEIKPGMLVNPKTCPWYLDDLAEQSAMYQGFLYFVEGKKDEALAQYKRILDVDPQTRRMDTKGEWNDYSRLKFGVEHGYLVAQPDELNAYSPKQRLAVLLGDFHYVTQDFEGAAAIFSDLVKDKHGPLTPKQREYPLYALGLSVYRGHWLPGTGSSTKEAWAVWEKALALRTGTLRSFQIGYTMANLAYSSTDPVLSKRVREILTAMAQNPEDNEFTNKARIMLAMELLAEGKKQSAVALLGRIKEADAEFYALAQYLIKNGGLQMPQPRSGS
jgi:tetratricopeptide (TPR) repeat protein